MASLYNTPRRGPRPASGLGLSALLLCFAIAALGVLTTAPGCGARKPARPNVLLVVISGLRADHVSAYGYRRATTPAVDALAAAGTLFEQAIATAPWGLTSQASILTGLYPSEHAAAFDHPGLDPSLVTLPETLRESGYATFAASTDPLIGKENGFFQGIDAPASMAPDQETSPDEGGAAAEQALAAWLAGRKGDDAAKPFFAWVVLTNPTLPFNPPGEYRQKFLEKPIPLPRLDQLSQFWMPFARQFNLGVTDLSADDLGALVALYDGEVGYADYRLGRMVANLRSAGLIDDTLVIVTADVGENLGDHGLLAESTRLYDSMVRVPLVMSLPGRLPSGRRVAEQVQTVDIARAVVALTAETAPGAAGGGALPPDASPMPHRPVAISESRFDPAALRAYRSIAPGADLTLFEGNMLGARTPEFKYIVTSGQLAALFDLKQDPGETTSILSSRMSAARDLADKLRLWQVSLKAGPRGSALPQAAGATPHAQEPPAAQKPAR